MDNLNYYNPKVNKTNPRRKTLIILNIIGLIVLVGVIIGGWLFLSKKNIKPSLPFLKTSSKPYDGYFWGVATNPYVFNTKSDKFHKENVDAQVEYWKDLGVKAVRINFEFSKQKPENFLEANDYLVDKLNENNIETLMVIESPLGDFIGEANQDNGYSWGKHIAEHFKGKVRYYQMLNEVSGTAIKPNYPGNNFSDFDSEKYRAVKDYLLGLSKGIKEADPDAKRVVSAHWVGIAIIDKLIEDGVDFEIIGWNWFSSMGDDPTNVKMPDGSNLNIPDYLKKYNKKFWITEANRSEGSYDNKEKEQAEFINSLINNIKKSDLISGIFVYRLFDTTSAADGVQNNDTVWGIVKEKQKADGKWEPGAKKEAFDTYRSLIAKYGNKLTK